MKGCAVFSLVLALALLAVPATAAHTAVAVVGYYGVYYPVIGGGAILTLTVKNNASSTHSINKVELDFEASGFKVVWANGAGWATSNTETTCTYEVTGIESPIAPNATKMFSTKVTLPWTIAQYDFAVTTYDSGAGSYSFRTGNKVNVSYSSCGNAETVDLFHASSTPTANMLLPLGGDAKYDGAILRDATVSGAKLMDGAVTTPKLADLAVTNDKIAAFAVTWRNLADGSVTTPSIADDAVTDAKIPDLWRTVNLPILGAQLMNGAELSPDMAAAGIDFPVPGGGFSPQLALPIEMPADWDAVANPTPYVELVWWANDSVNNRGKAVRWWLDYSRRRVGEPFAYTGAGIESEWITDPLNAQIIQSTGTYLGMGYPSYKPEVPNEVVSMRIMRRAATIGVELPASAHLLAARLWYIATR